MALDQQESVQDRITKKEARIAFLRRRTKLPMYDATDPYLHPKLLQTIQELEAEVQDLKDVRDFLTALPELEVFKTRSDDDYMQAVTDTCFCYLSGRVLRLMEERLNMDVHGAVCTRTGLKGDYVRWLLNMFVEEPAETRPGGQTV